jgi:hypothetical protein
VLSRLLDAPNGARRQPPLDRLPKRRVLARVRSAACRSGRTAVMASRSFSTGPAFVERAVPDWG